MERLFTTVPSAPDMFVEWDRFTDGLIAVAGGDVDSYYAYPDLQARIAASKSEREL